MEEIDCIFFVDFDGTVATVDVCEKMVTAFAGDGWQEINELWERKELSTVECARQTLKLFRTNDPADFYNLLNDVTIDPGFGEFLTYCRERGYPVVILSDGYSFYIEHLLQREGIELPYYANTMVFHPELDIEAPYISENCDLCGVCKLELMQKLAPAAKKTVYIGDGYSDFCPACSADVVFGKTRLYEHCLREGKTVYHFTDFNDIVQQLRIINKE